MKPSCPQRLLCAAITLLAIATAFIEALATGFLITSGLLMAVWLFDFIGVWRLSDFRVSRQVNKNLPIYAWTEITLRLQHGHERKIPLLIHDYHPSHFLVEGQPRRLLLAPNTISEIKYRIKPLQRGDAEFAGLDLMLNSPFGLWQRRLHIDLPAGSGSIRTLPRSFSTPCWRWITSLRRWASAGVSAGAKDRIFCNCANIASVIP